MSTITFILSAIFLGVLSAVLGGYIIYRNLQKSRINLIEEITAAENHLIDDINQIGTIELSKTKYGRELLFLIDKSIDKNDKAIHTNQEQSKEIENFQTSSITRNDNIDLSSELFRQQIMDRRGKQLTEPSTDQKTSPSTITDEIKNVRPPIKRVEVDIKAAPPKNYWHFLRFIASDILRRIFSKDKDEF